MALPPTDIPVRENGTLVALIVVLNAIQFAVVPLLLAQSPWWALLLVPVVLSTTPTWALIHEGIHNNLHPDRRVNERRSRLVCILFGSPFQLLRLGHLMHHRFNRSELNRPEVEPTDGLLARLRYYALLLGGLWIGELVASVLAVLPDRFYRQIIILGFGDETPDGKSMWAAARRQLLEEPGRTRMRIDGAIITALFTLAFLAYGPHWWVLALALYGRALLVSFFDNAYHYANPLDEPMAGHNLALPRWAERWFLNYNYHAVHHARPQVPWSGLRDTFGAEGHRYGGGFARAALRQLRGPIEEQALAEPTRPDLPLSSHLPR